MSVWFTGDYHFHHYNILKYTNRPWDGVKEMHDVFLSNYEDKVDKDDEVYILGDLMLGGPKYKRSLCRLIDQMPGDKHLILGNHDRLNHRHYIDIGFSSVHTFFPFEWEYGTLYLIHDPAHAVKSGCNYLSAHIHDLWQYRMMDTDSLCVNVGVDAWNYTPVALTTINEVIEDHYLERIDDDKNERQQGSC